MRATEISEGSAADPQPLTVGPSGGGVPAANVEPRPGRRLAFIIVSIALLMSSVDQTIVATALPTLQRDLHATINWSSWTITIYALFQILAMPLASALSDQYGRKRVFLVSVVIFTVASLCCGLSTSMYMLIPLRAVQAVGGGAFLPSASGIVSDMYGRERDRALGLFSGIFPLGGVIGPILGGIFVTYWSWRGIFLVNVPIGILLFALAARYIPHTPAKPAARLDLRGVALLGGLLLLAMSGVASLGSGRAGLLDPTFLALEALAVVLGIAFVRHIRRTAAPVIPPMLLFGRGFAVMNTINFLFGSAALGFGALVPLYAEDRFGVSSLSAGTLLTARAVGMFCAATLAVLALRRTGYRRPMIVGFLIIVIGLVVMAVDRPHSGAYGWLAIGAGITGVGMGVSQPASNNAVMQLAPTQVAAVAGLRGMIRQSGAITAVSVTSTVIARSAHPGIALGHAFLIFAAILVLSLPLVLRIPDHRGSW